VAKIGGGYRLMATAASGYSAVGVKMAAPAEGVGIDTIRRRIAGGWLAASAYQLMAAQ